MKTINEGGPAFPFDIGDVYSTGMTMRDYFAAKVLQGFCAAPEYNWDENSKLARRCYAIADAMVKARDAS